MTHILSFDHPHALSQSLTGGKGVNLARLFQAGFRVPPGFCVSADAYADFMAARGLQDRLRDLVGRMPAGDPSALERTTAAIRDLILNAHMPDALAGEIERAYAALGEESFVAVRSSGTAEDLAAASFAGQHDTYLDVQGGAEVVAAVQRCWASLWTARAVNYRDHHRFDHGEVRIAVVVQKMIRSDVAGVLFTANPLTTATDETVINATWGLGEALVQGIVTPDQFIVQMPTCTVIEQTIGGKEHRIVRSRNGSGGVVTEDVPAGERARACLQSADISALARLGERVQAYYGGFPQDIEWAIEDGVPYLLQSRPITGVEFTWDADVDAAHTQEVAADAVWTRAFADALTTGAVTPLTYSSRFPVFGGRNLRRIWEIAGFKDVAEMRFFKYWKGELYYNVETERQFLQRLVPPFLRPMLLDFIPPVQQEEILNAPFDEAQCMRSVMRWFLIDNESTPTAFLPIFEKWRKRTDVEGLPNEELRKLEDEELIAHCHHLTGIFGDWNDPMYISIPITLRLLMSGMSWMVNTWYDGGNPQGTFAKLVSGAIRRTDTQVENTDLQAVARVIRKSPTLRKALDVHDDASFFDHLATFDEGKRFIEVYQRFLAKWGHRGHADRDYIYPRRIEDPAIDVRAFKIMMNTDESHDSEAAEREVNRVREATFAQVLANLATKPGGAKKVEIFKFVYNLAHEYLVMRDNERGRPTDLLTFSRKRAYCEIGRRLYERGQIENARDFHFLSELELYQLLRNRIENPELLKAKIVARAKVCDRILRKEVSPPRYLQRNRPIDLDHPLEEGVEGVFKGTPTSPGTTTGTARIVMDHREMGRVARGEILVTHSTDPGWNPVFSLISAVVVETGGLLSHASCLAREYGFPAVHLPNAAKLIRDGAIITVDGHSGVVKIVEAETDGPIPLAAAGE